MTLDPALREILDGTPIAHLATVLPDGAPHAVPVWIGTHGEDVVFMTGRDLRRPATCAGTLAQRSR